MRLQKLVTGTILAIAVATGVGSATVRAEPDQSTPSKTKVSVAAESAGTAFATLKGVKAEPMAAKELDAVKGQHVHFLDANGGFHLAGNPEHANNWENLGGSDPAPVAPSYHGLCVAAGYSGPSAPGGIVIPGGETQCSLN